ncbi:PREDICTED: receptor-transporting protein 4 [Chrysochloris asiatica]|uniref:Receptor-transporting protein 4 n=1 Tax=Chrysochloris asiatica TaxID=185453 RepID=A0A9B0TWA1_CHRAS|nr:PREDICTED: receptor-transporting protein 4 [Chrysochloris asiatica]
MALDINSWEQIFQDLIQQVEPWARWTLKLDETLQPDCMSPGWKQYQQKAFGRFQCSSCQRRWASAKVQVLCQMYWEHWRSQGQVLMRFFAQRCKKCHGSQFEKPEFSSESTMMILNNLVQRILERFYSVDMRTAPPIPVTAEVPLQGPHDTTNCEACLLGFCTWDLQNLVAQPPTTSLSYVDIGRYSPSLGDGFVQTPARNQSANVRAYTDRTGPIATSSSSGRLSPDSTFLPPSENWPTLRFMYVIGVLVALSAVIATRSCMSKE